MTMDTRNYTANISGVAATEFALIFPILIFIMIAVVDFGMYMNMSLKIENVARASAQYVLQGGAIEDVDADVIVASNLGVGAGEVDADIAYVCECGDGESVSCDGTCNDSGDYLRQFIEVTLAKEQETIIPYPGMADNLTLIGHVRLQAN